MGDQSSDLLKGVKNRDYRALAKLLTLLERTGPVCLERFPDLLAPTHPSLRIGITGPPGAGKSTLIGALLKDLRARGLTVGVLAVDPSSPFSKGAVLGDRIRYGEHFSDAGVYIRSLGSRGSLGGLSSSTYLMVRAMDLAAFDVVLIETVGVGQTELEIMHVADWVAVVLVPESGDSIQAMKAGLLEIADLFVVNKSDRPGADAFKHELETSLLLDAEAERPIVISTSASRGEGVSELVERILAERATGTWQARRQDSERLKSEARALLREEAERAIEARLPERMTPAKLGELFRAPKKS